MTLQSIEEEQLGELTKIGQGGQGIVFAAPKVHISFAPSMVYKRYKRETLAALKAGALSGMPQLLESFAPDKQRRLIKISAWPCAVVEKEGSPVGFLMPSIPEAFFISLKTVKGSTRTIAEFQHLLNEPSYLDERGIRISETQKYTLIRELASSLAFLHEHDIYVGDMSPKNLLFSLVPNPAVYFLDCDAMRVSGVSALADVETVGWEVPAGEPVATKESDVYKMALLALRLLAGDQDESDPTQLPASMPDNLRQLITDTLTKPPEDRPLPAVWIYLLDEVLKGTSSAPPPRGRPVQSASRNVSAPKPQMRSRPGRETAERPPVHAPQAATAYYQPATPNAATSKLSGSTAVALAAVAGLVVMGVVLANTLSGGNSGSSSSRTVTSYTTERSAAASAPTTVAFAAPPLYQGMDATGYVRCPEGLPLSESGRRAGIGSESTSCQFAKAVGESYWQKNSIYSPGSGVVLAYSDAIDCRDKPGADCDGSAFKMYCSFESNGPWVECTNPTGARVYLF